MKRPQQGNQGTKHWRQLCHSEKHFSRLPDQFLHRPTLPVCSHVSHDRCLKPAASEKLRRCFVGMQEKKKKDTTRKIKGLQKQMEGVIAEGPVGFVHII